MDYTLQEKHAPRERVKIVPPRRNHNLRKGGGRKNSPGWTEQNRKTNRLRLDQLRGVIKTAVTIIYPATATPAQLSALNDCNRNFCKEKRIPSRSVWEGPGRHQHIALGIPHDSNLERLWIARLRGQWLALFGSDIGPKAFLWKPEIQPDKIASYLSKTRKNGVFVKMAYSWLTFTPYWEVGFRALVPDARSPNSRQTIPRKKSVASVSTDSPVHPDSPRYTVTRGQTSEKERELCTVCWKRWGKSLWAGSCMCNPSYPYC